MPNDVYFKAMSVLGCGGSIAQRERCLHNCCDGENCIIWLERLFREYAKYQASIWSAEAVNMLKTASEEGRMVILAQRPTDCDKCIFTSNHGDCVFVGYPPSPDSCAAEIRKAFEYQMELASKGKE